MKKKILFTPCSSSDIEKIESWLQDLSAEGLILCKDSLHSLYGIFEITEPQICRYRLQPSANADRFIRSEDDPDEKLIHICEENSWQCVSKFGRFLVFSCSDPSAAELNTDPIVQAASLEKGMTAGTLMLILYMILFAVNIHNAQGSYNQMFYMIWVILMVLLLVLMGIEFMHIWGLWKSLRKGQELNHHKDWHRGSAQTAAARVLIIALLLMYVISFAVADRQQNTAEENARLHPIETVDASLIPENVSEGIYLGAMNTIRVTENFLYYDLSIENADMEITEIYVPMSESSTSYENDIDIVRLVRDVNDRFDAMLKEDKWNNEDTLALGKACESIRKLCGQ